MLETKFQAMQNEETQTTIEPTESRADLTVQSQTDVKKVEASSTDEKNESDGHNVPYKRFKEVNESKKVLKTRADELERQLSEARAQLNSRGSKQKESPDDIIDYMPEFYKEFSDPADPKVSSLEKRLQNFEMKAAQAELEMEISGISRKYPDVPQQVLLQACINDPEKNLEDVAREYSMFIAEIEERALAKHAKRSAPTAPPRPNSVGSLSPSTSNKPRTMADARAAALAFMKQQGIWSQE